MKGKFTHSLVILGILMISSIFISYVTKSRTRKCELSLRIRMDNYLLNLLNVELKIILKNFSCPESPFISFESF